MPVATTILTTHSSLSHGGDLSPKSLSDRQQTLKADLSRYTRANDRSAVLQTLKDSSLLRNIPLEAVQEDAVDTNQLQELEVEVCRSTIVLNGTTLRPNNLSTTEVLRVLQELCLQLCKTPDSTMTATALYQALIVRLAETTSAADAYFQLNALLGSQDLILQPASERTMEALAFTELTVYKTPENGMLHVQTVIHHAYGLFRKADVNTGQPWINLQATVSERCNLTNRQTVRSLRVQELDVAADEQ